MKIGKYNPGSLMLISLTVVPDECITIANSVFWGKRKPSRVGNLEMG